MSLKPITIPLHGFDYVHSPDDENISGSRHLFAGRDALINRLVSLLESGHHKRGSYLVAGYRGVGKTSIVNRAIEKYATPDKEQPPKKSPKKPIVIKINLGDNTQLTPLNIYFSIANFLLEEFSSDNGKLTHIHIKEIKEKLEGLVDRMGHEISDNRGFGTATNAGVDAETGTFLNLFSSIKGRLGASVEVSNSKSKRMLPISPREAEEQVLKILVSINKDANSEVIFIFDEIDKLSNSEEFTASSYQRRAPETSPQDKHTKINTLLGSLKNFITTAQATFFFISGRETLDRYYSEKGSPNSLYESLFDSVFEVPSLLTDERYYSSRAWRMALLIEEYLCRRLMEKQEEGKESYTLQNYHKTFIEKNTGKHSDGRLLISTLRNFIYYLTFHSWGNPKRLSSILESFLVPGHELKDKEDKIKKLAVPGDECGCWLFFNAHQLRAFSLAAELITLFDHHFSREISKISDKLMVTSLASLQFILKHHSYGFTRESLSRMSEAMSVHRSPALNAIVDDLLTQTFKSYIRRIRNGVYRYRFHSGFEQELRYISHVNELESATYNFSLDSMRHVKRFFEDVLARADKTGKSAIWHSHITLGDICAIEQSYNEASEHYCSAIRLLKGEVSKLERSADMEFLMLYVEVMVKNGDLEERRQNYHHAAAIYAEAEQTVNNVVAQNEEVQGKLQWGDSKWDLLKQPFWAGQYLSLKRSPSSRDSSRDELPCPKLLYAESDPRFQLRAATLAFFSGNTDAAKKHYTTIHRNLAAIHGNLGCNELPYERDDYINANSLVGRVEAELVAYSHAFAKKQYESSGVKQKRETPKDEEQQQETPKEKGPVKPEFIGELLVFLKKQFTPPGILEDLRKAACILEENRIYISAAIVHMKMISYLSTILDAFSEKDAERLVDVAEEIHTKVKECGKSALRCINKARQMESSQSGKTLLIRDLDDSNYKKKENLDIPKLFDLLLGPDPGPEAKTFPLKDQIYWQQSLWAHKLAAVLVWAQFVHYKVKDNDREISLPSDFSTLSVRPSIVMCWLHARDISRRCIDGHLVKKGGVKCRPLEIFKAHLPNNGNLALTEKGKEFADFCASFNRGTSQKNWPGALEDAYLICENLYFSLTSIRIISRRNMDLIFPRMSQIYFTQWKLLTNLAAVILLDRNSIASPAAGEKLESVRDISFLLQRMFVKMNKEKAAHERIPPSHYDYEHIYLRLCESLDSAASLADQTSRARTGIYNNKYYCHDDYNDAEFRMDYTLAYMFTPSALFLREHVEDIHGQFERAVGISHGDVAAI